MLKKIIKLLLLILYSILVISYCFLPAKALNVFLSSKIFFAHFYSFPILFGLFFLVIGILIFIVGLIKNKKEYLAKLDFLFPLGIFVASILFIFFSSDVKKNTYTENNKPSIKVVALNAQNTLDSEAITKIFKVFDADITVLPEFGGYAKGDKPETRLGDLMKNEGIQSEKYSFYSSVETQGHIAPVTIVIKKSFNEYKQTDIREMTRFGTVYLNSDQTDLPNIIGLHTAPPLPGLMEMWDRDLDLMGKKILPEHKEAIVLGDFNATGRHGSMNLIDSHEDVLDYLPRFEKGTWGLFLPKFLRTSIDHVYIPKDKYQVKNVDLYEFKGPDHMGILVELIYK